MTESLIQDNINTTSGVEGGPALLDAAGFDRLVTIDVPTGSSTELGRLACLPGAVADLDNTTTTHAETPLIEIGQVREWDPASLN